MHRMPRPLGIMWAICILLAVSCKPEKAGTRQQPESANRLTSEPEISITPANPLIPAPSGITDKRHPSANSVPIVRSMLAKLPRIVDGDRVDEAYLIKAGVPDTEAAAVGNSALEAFRNAKELRKKQTESMRFDFDQRVEIAPLDEQRIESVMREFKRQLPSQVPPEVAGFLVSRLTLQLQEIFGTGIWATLKYSDVVDFKDLAHLPKELRGLYFEIEFLPDAKHPHPLHVSAIPGNYSPYFFLKVPPGVTNEGKAMR